MDQKFLQHLTEVIGSKLASVSPVAGGDINQAYCLKSTKSKFFLKYNQNALSSDMFDTEAKALLSIADSGAIKTPKIIYQGVFHKTAYLILEFIETVSFTNAEAMFAFGEQLGRLHAIKQDYFGWEYDNYIGTLSQKNPMSSSWSEFYINNRLETQIALALDNGYLSSITNSKLIDMFYKRTEQLLQNVNPSLLHGDLWGGNFIIDKQGIPYLIDPASYYGHSEVDLAMTELFGGFSDYFYQGYDSLKPIENEYKSRKYLYQLYYLLVHLNLFGKSYEPTCLEIINKYL